MGQVISFNEKKKDRDMEQFVNIMDRLNNAFESGTIQSLGVVCVMREEGETEDAVFTSYAIGANGSYFALLSGTSMLQQRVVSLSSE